MRLLCLIFDEIADLNTREVFRNHQIAKLNAKKCFFFFNLEIKYPRNLIPFRSAFVQVKADIFLTC